MLVKAHGLVVIFVHGEFVHAVRFSDKRQKRPSQALTPQLREQKEHLKALSLNPGKPEHAAPAFCDNQMRHGPESLRHKAPDFGDAFGRQEGMSGSYGSLPKGGEFSNEFVLAFSDFPDCDIGRVHGL